MKLEAELRDRVKADLDSLNSEAAANAFPPSDALSQVLNQAIPHRAAGTFSRNISQPTATMFTTAAINMWMRGVHSFLVSSSLTGVSPVWASSAGYYSSHYSIRAFAHLLGFFRLFTRKRTARVGFRSGRYSCTFHPRAGREHQIYWEIVKDDQHFVTDPFFIRINSEVAHRDWAQYVDHLPHFPAFRPIDKQALRARIDRISQISFTSPPIPAVSKYPDVDSVQVIAYHRLVRFRNLVDVILGGKNRFWDVNRNPQWAIEFMDFQLVEGSTLHSEFTL